MRNFNAKRIPASLTVAFHGMAYDLRQKGERIFDLTAGEAKVPTHPLLLEALQERMENEPVYYAPVKGIWELREAATSWMNRSYSCSLSPSECLVTGGGKFGLYLLFASLLHPNDDVLIPSPYWVTYPTLTEYWGGVPVVVETREEDNFCVTVQALEKAVTPKSKILVLNNAGNPTGALYSKEALQAILDFAQKNDLIVFSDEVYSGLTYEGSFVSCAAFPEHRERVFVVQSCSKSFAMTGWRVGMVFGPEDVLEALASLQSQSLTSASTVSQWMATTAFQNADTITDWLLKLMRERRNHFVSTFSDVFGVALKPPAAALYTFINLDRLGFDSEQSADSLGLCTQLLESSRVAMVPGAAFGKEGFVRCSFAGNPSDVEEALKRWKAYRDKSKS